MKVEELSREQLTELKGFFLADLDNESKLKETVGIDAVSWEVLMNIDNFVSDEMVFEQYQGISLGNDDFFCCANN